MLGLIDELVEYKECTEYDKDWIVVMQAKFKQDFFPFSEGDEVDALALIDKDSQTWLIEYDANDNEKRKVRVALMQFE